MRISDWSSDVCSSDLIAVDMPGAGQTAVIAAMPTVGRDDADWAALRIANAGLGGGFQGWLTQEIRVKRGLSYSAGSLLDTRRDAALLLVATQTKNESAIEVAGDRKSTRLNSSPYGASRMPSSE